MCDRKICSCII